MNAEACLQPRRQRDAIQITGYEQLNAPSPGGARDCQRTAARVGPSLAEAQAAIGRIMLC